MPIDTKTESCWFSEVHIASPALRKLSYFRAEVGLQIHCCKPLEPIIRNNRAQELPEKFTGSPGFFTFEWLGAGPELVLPVAQDAPLFQTIVLIMCLQNWQCSWALVKNLGFHFGNRVWQGTYRFSFICCIFCLSADRMQIRGDVVEHPHLRGVKCHLLDLACQERPGKPAMFLRG